MVHQVGVARGPMRVTVRAMYRQHAGPPPPDPFAAGEKNARACGYLQLGSVGMTALSVTLFVLQVRTSPGFAFVSADTRDSLLLYALGYVLVAGLWAAINAWGLSRRSRLAHYSSFVFGIAQLFTCFGTMFGIGLIFLLSKPEMKGYYDARIGS